MTPFQNYFWIKDFWDGHEIFTINADGTNNTRLTENDYPDYWPKWSPDSSKILFYKAAKRYDPVSASTDS